VLELLSVVKQYGWSGLLFAGAIFLFYKLIGDTLFIFTEKAKNTLLQRKEVKLQLHAFFNAISYSIDVEVPAIILFHNEPNRQLLLKDLLLCTLHSVEEVTEKIAAADHSHWNYIQWNYEMLAAISEMNVLFVTKCVEKGIPEVVYNTYLRWYLVRLNHMRVLSNQIASNSMYATAEIKTSTLFLAFNYFIVSLMGDAILTMKTLNGELTGTAYRGLIIEPLPDHGSHE
jgi:hypothetical protein